MVQASLSSPSLLLLRYNVPHVINTEWEQQSKAKPIKCASVRRIKFHDYHTDHFSRFYYDQNRLHMHQLQQRSMQSFYCEREMMLFPTPTTSTDQTFRSTSSGTRRNGAGKRHVHFNESTCVHHLPARTIEDHAERWYSKTDYSRFNSERKRTVDMIRSLHKSNRNVRDCLDENEYTTTGLDHYMYGKEHMMRRKMNALRHVRSVLQQQQQQQRQRQQQQQQQRYNQIYHRENYNFSTCNNSNPKSDDTVRYMSYQCPTSPFMIRRSPLQEILHVL
jgi:hypothetical protein